MPNNQYREEDCECPTPRDYQGGSRDFGVVRQQDGHVVGRSGEKGRNVHQPNG